MKLFLLLLLVGAAVAAAIRALIGLVQGRALLQPAPPGQLVSQRIRFGGLNRTFLIYVPTKQTADRRIPLVLAFHGGGGTADRMAKRTAIHVLAQEEGFIAVYPQGTGFALRHGATWNAGGVPPQGWAERHRIDDIGFVRQLIVQLSAIYAIDSSRIYAVGLSKGGMLAYHLACHLSEMIAAIGAVAATMTSAGCRPRNTVAIMHVHGTADQNVPLEGGRGARTARDANWPPVVRGLEYWRKHNRCASTPRLIDRQGSISCWQYDAPETGSDVRYYIIEGGRHSWPGAQIQRGERQGRRIGDSFSTTRELWRFFLEHPKAPNKVPRRQVSVTDS